MKPLILIGGGGHCKSVIEAAESIGWQIRGILDMPERMGFHVLGHKVIGTDDDIALFVPDCLFIVTLGFISNPSPRIALHEKVKACGGKLATVVASTAHVSEYATIGDGSVVLHGAMVNAGAKVGRGCIINTLANIEHDSVVGDYAHVSTGCMVNGDCRVGDATFLGSGCILHNGVSVPRNSIFSAGSVIHKSFSTPGIYAGAPVSLKIKL